MSSEGVARASGVQKRHVSQYVRPLIREGQVRQRLAHVQGLPQRRKVYDLTDSGRATAIRLRRRVEKEIVRVRDGAELRPSTIAQVLAVAGGKLPLLDFVRLTDVGAIDLDALKREPPATFVEMLSDSPRLGRFLGRKRELEAVTSRGDKPRIFVVRGVAGIGKTWFGAKACELLRGKRNLFWRRIRPWDTLQSILMSLGSFLSDLGKPGLQAVLARGESSRAPDVLRDDLSNTNSFLVFDDAHEGSTEVVSFFRLLKEVVGGARDLSALVLARQSLRFYNRRDVVDDGVVRELELSGLALEDLETLLSDGGNPGLLRAIRRFGGLPLALQLVRSVGPEGISTRSLEDVHRFLEEEVFGDLSTAGRMMMKIASMYRVPVPKEALFVHPSLTYDVLLNLENRSLLLRTGEGRYEAHDTIRDFFSSVLTPSERSQLGKSAASNLRQLASEARERGDLLLCADLVSNALALPAARKDHLTLWETMGDVRKELGDLPACLSAFREAINQTNDRETVARLHRKIAWALLSRGDASHARAEVEEGLRALRNHASAERGWFDLLESFLDENESWQRARQHADEALRMFREFQVLLGEGKALLWLGHLELHSPDGDRASARQHYVAARDVSRRLSDPVFASQVDRALAHMYAWHLGDVQKGLEHLAEAKNQVGERGGPEFRLWLLFDEAEINLELRANYAIAEQQFLEFESRGRRIYDRSAGFVSRFNLALSLYLQNRVDEARKGFERLLGDPSVLDSFTRIRTMWLLAECCLMQRDFEGVRRVAIAFDDPITRKEAEGTGGSALPVPASILRGVHCLLKGDAEGSQVAFAHALQLAGQASQIDEAPALSWSYLGPFYSGIALRVWGNDLEATERVRQAAEILRRYGMKARLSVLPDQERALTNVLREAYEGIGADAL